MTHDRFTTGGTSRRAFLGALGVSAAALSGGALAGCGERHPDKASGAGDVKMPTTKERTIAKPDLSSKVDGAPDGYYSYPSDPKPANKEKPLNGEQLSVLGFLFGATPNDRKKNPAWQKVESKLGGKVDFQVVASDDYKSKFSTVTAGGDLPDIMMNDGDAVKDKANFLKSKCADLTDHLSGDAVTDYPNLAALPKISWQSSVTDGKLYEIPIPRNVIGGCGFINQTFFEKAGVKNGDELDDIDDFTSLLKDLTNAKKNRWALGSMKFGLSNYYAIFKVPNTWKSDDHKLTYYTETDEYAHMIEYLAKMRKKGYFAPGSEGWTKNQMINAFNSGKVALIYDGLPAYMKSDGYAKSLPKTRPDDVAMPFLPFGHDGGKAGVWADNINVSTVMVKKGSKKHTKTVLRLIDWLAAPFGSSEYLLLNYGVEGDDYKVDDHGNPRPTSGGVEDTGVPWGFVGAPAHMIYDPTKKSTVKNMFETYQKLVPGAVKNPCETLYSPTESKKGQSINQPVADKVTSIIAGRSPMSDLKKALKKWREQGGDKIRDEYEKALGN